MATENEVDGELGEEGFVLVRLTSGLQRVGFATLRTGSRRPFSPTLDLTCAPRLAEPTPRAASKFLRDAGSAHRLANLSTETISDAELPAEILAAS